jgi:hypothetical protein
MITISEVRAPAGAKTYIGYIMDCVAILCGLGVVMAACMATSGLDMSVGFF